MKNLLFIVALLWCLASQGQDTVAVIQNDSTNYAADTALAQLEAVAGDTVVKKRKTSVGKVVGIALGSLLTAAGGVGIGYGAYVLYWSAAEGGFFGVIGLFFGAAMVGLGSAVLLPGVIILTTTLAVSHTKNKRAKKQAGGG